MNIELRRLTAENAELRAALRAQAGTATDPGSLVGLTADLAALRLLCADVRTSLLAAGWHDDAILRRLDAATAAGVFVFTAREKELAALVRRALALDNLSPAARALEERAIVQALGTFSP